MKSVPICWSAIFMACACATEPMSSASLWPQIQAEVGAAVCDGPQQCRTIAIGAKACGGPESYLAWSTQQSDGQKLKSLVAQHRSLREAELRRSGMVSDCSFVTDPGASCQAGRCELLQRADGKTAQ
jgi:hypothetical protein